MSKHSRVIPQGKSHYCITTSSSELPRDKRVGGAVNELSSLVESHDSTSMGSFGLHSRQQALGLSSTVAFSFLVRGNNKNKHIVNSYCARQFLSSSTSFKIPCFIKWDLGFKHNKKCLLHGLAGVFFPWLLEAHQYASVCTWVRIHIYGHDWGRGHCRCHSLAVMMMPCTYSQWTGSSVNLHRVYEWLLPKCANVRRDSIIIVYGIS